ncbi:Elongator complex protein 4 [Dimargaris cristalligena]|uniref:Elongator complex protein 4 n=1 Tax=Dimargaris cristalligena TaxID=215637 RepID=A0A4Q0A1S4_9FUNG|nr:Elongator complex protein 4 [Dimargaris cristalligena]|eukprot:RKP39110.1 Elongator complex protein 4 [Dimargaris cristalligena]
MSSFRKRTAAIQPKLPAGAKLSPHNGQVLVSSGIPSLDDLLGGGLPVGSVVLVLSDRYTDYSNILLRYFVAQGLASGHQLHLASADMDPQKIIQRAPSWTTTSPTPNTSADSPAVQKTTEALDKLKIAWRYQNLPTGDQDTARRTTGTTPFCEKFDLMVPVKPRIIDQATVSYTDLTQPRNTSEDANEDGNDKDRNQGITDDYEALFAELAHAIEDGGFSSLAPAAKAPAERNILRIGIHDLASPYWQAQSDESCARFLHALRGLLRFSFGVCMITLPAHLYQTESERPGAVRRWEQLCDAVVELESFNGSRNTKATAGGLDCNGFFYIHKQPQLNSLVPSSSKLVTVSGNQLSANNLAFKQKRHKFYIETFYLPPEGGVSERRVEPRSSSSSSAAGKTSKTASSGRACSSLDF